MFPYRTLFLTLTLLSNGAVSIVTASPLPPKNQPFGTAQPAVPLSALDARDLLGIIADEKRFSAQARQEAFEELRRSSPATEANHLSYCGEEEIPLIGEVPSHLYAQIIQSMTISCVDVFIYDFEKKSYLMIQRASPPVQGEWWMPGGRIFKGESFYQSAVRKTKKECGLDVCPIAQLGTYSTYFPDSAWGPDMPTDTKNTVVLALSNSPHTAYDEHHLGIKWVSIEEAPNDPYLLKAYQEARAKLSELHFLFF